MAQFKKTVPVIIAVFILCFLVTMPSIFTGIKERTLLNRVVTEEIPENVLAGYFTKDLSASEKVELIIEGMSDDTEVAIVGGGIPYVENDAIIMEKACLELEELMDRGAMLRFDTSDCQFVSGTIHNYVDVEDISRSVSVMWVNLEFTSMMVDILMDVETSQIYEYNLYWDSYSVSDDEDLVGLDEMIHNFQEYTGLSEEEFYLFYDCSEAPIYIGLNRN